MRCTTCGFRWRDKSFFRREAGGLLGRNQTVCQACNPHLPGKHEKRVTANLIVSQFAWAPLVGWAYSQDSSQGIAVTVMLAASLVTLPLRIVVHEAGHAIAAAAVGRSVTQLVIGRGALLTRVRLGTAVIEVRRYAYAGGLMQSFDGRDRRSRWRWAVTIFGGPVANAVLAALAFWLAATLSTGEPTSTLVLSAALAGVGLSEGATAIFNLVPRAVGDDESVASDGSQLLALFSKEGEAARELRRLHAVAGLARLGRYEESADLALRAAPGAQLGPIFIAQALAAKALASGDGAALDWYLQAYPEPLMEGPFDNPQRRSCLAWLRGTIAWTAIKAARDDLASLIDEYSAEAAAASPDRPEMTGTRAAVLIRSGRRIEGVPMLIASVRRINDPRDKADLCSFLARALHEEGREEQAAAFEQVGRRFLRLAA